MAISSTFNVPLGYCKVRACGGAHAQQGTFEKASDCLYLHSSNEGYYAVLRHSGKLNRRSLEPSDKANAKRNRSDFKRHVGRAVSAAGCVWISHWFNGNPLHNNHFHRHPHHCASPPKAVDAPT